MDLNEEKPEIRNHNQINHHWYFIKIEMLKFFKGGEMFGEEEILFVIGNELDVSQSLA